MNIAFVMHGYSAPFPGACWTRIGHFASYFSRKGHHVIVFSTRSSYMRGFKKFPFNGIDIFHVFPQSKPDCFPARCINVILTFIYSLILVYLNSIDIVVITVPDGGPAIASYVACKLARKKIVFDYRDEWEDYYLIGEAKTRLSRALFELLKRIVALFYLKSNLVVTVTSPFYRNLRKRGVRKIRLIPNGADTAIFHPHERRKTRTKLSLSPKNFLVLYSAGLHVAAYYNIGVVVRAFEIFALENEARRAVLVLLGAGLEKHEFSPKNSRINVMNLRREKSLNEMAEIIACCDLAVIPFGDNPLHKNIYPARFFEYAACGIPIIAMAHEESILADLIKKHKLGLVVPPMKTQELAKAMKKIYLDGNLRKTASFHGSRLIKKEFNRDKLAQDFLSLLLSISSSNEGLA